MSKTSKVGVLFFLFRRGSGNYILSSLKSVSSSEEFDAMGENVRKCQFEQSWSECRRRLFREQVSFSPGFSWMDEIFNHQASLKCGCHPAGLQQDSHSSFPVCKPQGISCYRSPPHLYPSNSLIPGTTASHPCPARFLATASTLMLSMTHLGK